MGEKKGFFSRLVEGLTKTRDNIVSGIDSVFHGFSKIDDEFYEELEEILIMGDLGVKATESILDDLREKVKANHVKEPAECKQLLIDSIREQMDLGENAYEFENRKSVVLVIGVNGVGKTTSVGKLAGQLKDEGKKVILAAGSLIVIWIGIGLLRSKASLEGGRDVNVPVWKLITSAFVVTWLSPQAIIDGTMMLGAFRATLPAGTDVPFICGFGSASVIWFLTVSTLVSLLGSKFNEKVLNVINKVCGAVIIFYGLKLLYSFVKMMGWL